MIKVSVTCANEDGKNFDMDYYCNNLMPMVHEKLGDALLKSEVVEEIGGTPAAYVAIGHIHFDSVYRFKAAFCAACGRGPGGYCELYGYRTVHPSRRSKGLRRPEANQ